MNKQSVNPSTKISPKPQTQEFLYTQDIHSYIHIRIHKTINQIFPHTADNKQWPKSQTHSEYTHTYTGGNCP